MQLRPGEPDTTPRYRTRRVQPAQPPPLRPVRLTAGTSLVQLAAGIDDHTVTNHHRERVRPSAQIVEDPFRELDRQSPIDSWLAVRARLRVVDHHHHFGFAG